MAMSVAVASQRSRRQSESRREVQLAYLTCSLRTARKSPVIAHTADRTEHAVGASL